MSSVEEGRIVVALTAPHAIDTIRNKLYKNVLSSWLEVCLVNNRKKLTIRQASFWLYK